MSKLLNKDLKNIKLRKEQSEALDFIFNTMESDTNKKNFLLDLPTGIGKSILALAFCKRYINEVDSTAKFDFITNSKLLQSQYFEEFDSPSNLWGKNNYECGQYSCSCESGKEFANINKNKCEDCPYDNAKNGYLHSQINLTNFHLFIMFNLYQESYLNQRKHNVLIIDECHDFEKIFSDFISLNLTEFGIKRLGLSKQSAILKSMNSIKDMDKLVEFFEELLINEISDRIGTVKWDIKKASLGSATSENRDLKIDTLFGEKTNSSIKLIKVLNDLEHYMTKIENFIKDYSNIPENWVMERIKNKTGQIEINVQPVWSHPYLDKYIWSKYEYVIMMSGTILDKNMFSYLNGLSVHQTAYHSIVSPFKIKNRPIYYMPLGKMTYTKKQDTFEKYVPFLNKLLKKYKNKKGIIHTHTYELAKWTKEKINDSRIIHHDYESKERALKIHYNGNKPSVLCSPSMTTGINLENDRARFQIMLKVPYPSLASKKNKMRQKTMPEWYAWQTVSGIIQTYGRAVRSYDDYADFIILDGSFTDVMLYSSEFIPEWVMKAVQRVDVNKLSNKK